MIKVTIPGYGDLTLEHVVFDYNGTLANTGTLITGVSARLNDLSNHLQIHIVSGDSFGTAREELKAVPCQLTILTSANQSIAKAEYIEKLNPSITIAVGNGRNDSNMLKKSCLGIAVVGNEGAAAETIASSNLVVANIFTVFDILADSRKLIATLRS